MQLFTIQLCASFLCLFAASAFGVKFTNEKSPDEKPGSGTTFWGWVQRAKPGEQRTIRLQRHSPDTPVLFRDYLQYMNGGIDEKLLDVLKRYKANFDTCEPLYFYDQDSKLVDVLSATVKDLFKTAKDPNEKTTTLKYSLEPVTEGDQPIDLQKTLENPPKYIYQVYPGDWVSQKADALLKEKKALAIIEPLDLTKPITECPRRIFELDGEKTLRDALIALNNEKLGIKTPYQVFSEQKTPIGKEVLGTKVSDLTTKTKFLYLLVSAADEKGENALPATTTPEVVKAIPETKEGSAATTTTSTEDKPENGLSLWVKIVIFVLIVAIIGGVIVLVISRKKKNEQSYA